MISLKLSTNNYVPWSKSFLLVISIRNKERFLNGTITKPTTIDPLFASKTKCNNLIVAWLLCFSSIVFFMKSTAKIWITLKQNFSQPDDTRVRKLQDSLGNVSQGTKLVDSYFIKLKAIWEEIRNY